MVGPQGGQPGDGGSQIGAFASGLLAEGGFHSWELAQLLAAEQRQRRRTVQPVRRPISGSVRSRGAIAGCAWRQVLTGHATCAQHQIRWCQQITIGRPAKSEQSTA